MDTEPNQPYDAQGQQPYAAPQAPTPQQSTAWAMPPQQYLPPAQHRGRPHRRWLAAGAVAALMCGAAGFGIGLATTHHGSTTATSSPSLSQLEQQAQRQMQGLQQQSGGQGYGSQGSGQGQYGFGSSGGDTSTEETTTSATSKQLVGLVRIQTALGYDDGAAAGTGMILTSDGEVITNHHVVQDATSIKVTVMSTGKTYTAEVVGTDATADVAVLQIEGASGLSTVSTSTDAVSVGDKVTAVGDAEGASTFSAATGKVSATDQDITTQSDGLDEGESLTGLIKISADVISGDSGGATYDSDGKVVAMTTAASTGGSEVDGYAIPITKVLSIADDIENHVTSSAYTYGRPGFIGVALSSQGTSTTVQQVYDDTPASKAGITAGDTITAVDGAKASTATQLTKAIRAHDPGDKIKVAWTDASGAHHTATLTLIAGPVA